MATDIAFVFTETLAWGWLGLAAGAFGGASAIECCYAATGIRASSTMTEIVEWTNTHVNFFHTN